MSHTKRRVRGYILSHQGWKKFQNAKTEWEDKEKDSYKITLEEIGELSGLATPTIRKILMREKGVDKSSISALFSSFNLNLAAVDCIRPYSQNELGLQLANKKIDWGEAIDVSTFYGRSEELEILDKWIVDERCRLITIVGMGGIGKTTLSVKLAQQLKEEFHNIIWRSLRDAPPVEDILTNLIQFLSPQTDTSANRSGSISKKISQFINCLRSSRSLVILDNVESLLCNENRAGIYQNEHYKYAELFRLIGEASHQSCILLTSREKLKELTFLEGELSYIRSLHLKGFTVQEGEKILIEKGFYGTITELTELIEYCRGNPLILKIAGTTIKDLFNGNVTDFFHNNMPIVSGIDDIISEHFQRLQEIEKIILYWLAINREPITLNELQENLVEPNLSFKLFDALQSLSRRCLIDKVESLTTQKASVRFTLQPVIMKYVTNKIIEDVYQEIAAQKPNVLIQYALVQATAKDYIEEAQKRLIIQPIIRMLGSSNWQESIDKRLNKILVTLQREYPLQPGYTAGNILNMLCYLRIDLKGYDYSNLCIWQADLRNVYLHDVNFQNSNFKNSAFSETFGSILSVAYAPNSKAVAAGESNGNIRIWRISDSQPLMVLKGHSSWVVNLNFSPDGNKIISSSSDKTIKLWNVKTGQCLKTFEEHKGEVWSANFSSDVQTIVSGSDDKTIKLWDINTGQCLKTFSGHLSWVTSVALSSDDQTIVSGSDDRTIKLWDINTGQCLKTFSGHKDGIRSVALSSDDQIVVSGSDDRTIKLWDINTGQCLKTFSGHTNRVFSVALNSKGDKIASGSHDCTIKIWDLNIDKCIQTFHGHQNWIFSVDFNSKYTALVSGSRDQTVKLWNLKQGQCVKTFKGYSNQVLSVTFSPDNQKIASASQDRTIKLWDLSTNQYHKIFWGHLNWVYSVSYSPQGDRLISGSGDQTVKLWNVNTGRCLKTFNGHSAAVRTVAFSPDGSVFASASEDSTIRLWDINTGQASKILDEHTAAIWSIAFSPDGKTLASGSFDRTIKLWDVGTGKCKHTLSRHRTWVWSVAFSPDGKILASSSTGGTVRFWNTNTGEYIKKLDSSTGWFLSTAFSSDGKMFATSSQDSTIKIWDTNGYKLINSLSGHENGYIWTVAFDSEDKIIASGSEDGTIKLWDTKTGKCINTLKAKSLYDGVNLQGATGLSETSLLNLKSYG
ncbi:MAG: NACHT domain-containing protein [Kamptonema sp. SIO1D9]|nr:NACHT domain-containing protein [Kamptonema sp. SIO1D9]